MDCRTIVCKEHLDEHMKSEGHKISFCIDELHAFCHECNLKVTGMGFEGIFGYFADLEIGDSLLKH